MAVRMREVLAVPVGEPVGVCVSLALKILLEILLLLHMYNFIFEHQTKKCFRFFEQLALQKSNF